MTSWIPGATDDSSGGNDSPGTLLRGIVRSCVVPLVDRFGAGQGVARLYWAAGDSVKITRQSARISTTVQPRWGASLSASTSFPLLLGCAS